MEMIFANTLKRLIRQRGLTVAELAAALELSPKTLSDWTAGTVPRDLGAVRACARYFNVTLHFILFGEEEGVAANKDLTGISTIPTGRYEIVIVRRLSE